MPRLRKRRRICKKNETARSKTARRNIRRAVSYSKLTRNRAMSATAFGIAAVSVPHIP